MLLTRSLNGESIFVLLIGRSSLAAHKIFCGIGRPRPAFSDELN
jgi:hypothetical protein